MASPPLSAYTFWDGEAGGRDIPFGSSSVQHGSAVFEGIRGYPTPDGPALFRLDDHLQRLLTSARALGIGHGYDLAGIRAFVLSATAATGLADCYVRPGLWARDPYLSIDIGRLPFTLGVEIWPMGSGEAPPAPMRLTVSPWRRPSPSSFPTGVKAVGAYANSALAKAAAAAVGCDDAVQLDPGSGRVAEATTSNVFLVRDGVLRTPWLRESLLAGITRDTVLALARQLAVPVEEAPVEPEELSSAAEVFLTGTASELVPAGWLDGRPYPGHRPVFDAIHAAFRDTVRGRRAAAHGWLTPVGAARVAVAETS